MIFTEEHCQKILRGEKTQTRRVVKPKGEIVWGIPDYDTGMSSIFSVQVSGRFKWVWGRDYAIQPGRTKKGVWWNPDSCYWVTDREDYHGCGNWQPLRIRITAIRQERLQDISAEDACAEGIDQEICLITNNPDPIALDRTARKIAIERYHELWDNINARKGTRWDDNPLVWVLTFELVKDGV